MLAGTTSLFNFNLIENDIHLNGISHRIYKVEDAITDADYLIFNDSTITISFNSTASDEVVYCYLLCLSSDSTILSN
jgi:hypothetical protein